MVKIEPNRISQLDGWRAISILLVLAGHMLPLGYGRWSINSPIAALGMALFFNLSGFLIARILLNNHNILDFIIKRLARIVPLAWLVLTIVYFAYKPELFSFKSNFLFYSNLPPFSLDYTGHFWSLCIEVQFYFSIAIFILLFGLRSMNLIPLIAIMITAWRIYSGVTISILTLWRVDEILAGCTLALIYARRDAPIVRRTFGILNPLFVFPFFLLSTFHIFSILDYLRPYLAATLIGSTIINPVDRHSAFLSNKYFRYIAQISYALYIIHPYTFTGWMGEGSYIVKYSKRFISFIILFVVSHVSTFYYEGPINRYFHRFSRVTLN